MGGRFTSGATYVDDLPPLRLEQFIRLVGQAVPEDDLGAGVRLVHVDPVQTAAERRVTGPEVVPVCRTAAHLMIKHDNPTCPSTVWFPARSARRRSRSHADKRIASWTYTS